MKNLSNYVYLFVLLSIVNFITQLWTVSIFLNWTTIVSGVLALFFMFYSLYILNLKLKYILATKDHIIGGSFYVDYADVDEEVYRLELDVDPYEFIDKEGIFLRVVVNS